MLARQARLMDSEDSSLVSFLLDGTDRAVMVLESVFSLDVASSDADIEVAPVTQSKLLQHLGSHGLYTVTSDIRGGLDGRMALLMRPQDFNRLGHVMKPILSLLCQHGPDSDLESAGPDKPLWLREDISPPPGGWRYHEQMMDLLTEMGNLLIGMYVTSLHQIFHLATDYSIPRARQDSEQCVLHELARDSDGWLHLIIEHEFIVDEHPINIWCLISPTRESAHRLFAGTRH